MTADNSRREELRACPFCGKGSVAQNGVFLETNGVYAWCRLCQAGVKKRIWNTRPIEDSLRAQLAALQAEHAKVKERLRMADTALSTVKFITSYPEDDGSGVTENQTNTATLSRNLVIAYFTNKGSA